MSVETLSDLVFHLREVAAGRGDLISIRHREGTETLSTTDLLRSVHSLALALEARGVEPGERLAILSENRPEWQIADLACQLLGAVTVPIAAGAAPELVGYVLRNSHSRWLFYSDEKKRDLLLELEGSLTAPPQMVAFDGSAAVAGGTSITRLMGEGAARLGAVPLGRFRGRVKGDDLATLLYPGDAGGEPRGVMLSHRNLVSALLACERLFTLGPDDLAISFLPLADVFQRTLDHLCLYRGAAICYVAESDRLPAAVRAVAPTVLAAPPAVYERAWRRTLEQVGRESAGRRRLFDWAVAVGKRHAEAARSGFLGPYLALQRKLAEALVYRRIGHRFGGRLRLALAAGGPLPRPAAEFYEAVGMPIYESYVAAGSSLVLASNAPGHRRPGSVGRPLPSLELEIGKNGEVQVRGPAVMHGYWQSPRATAAAIDEAGWLATGEHGRLDEEGFLYLEKDQGE